MWCLDNNNDYNRCAAAHVEARAQGLPHRPSLVVCPSTLVPHWPHEMARFVGSAGLTTLQYEGPPPQRKQLQACPWLLSCPSSHPVSPCACILVRDSQHMLYT